MTARVRTWGAVALVAAATVLTGCTNKADTAAIVDGRVITEQDARSAADAINAGIKPAQHVTTKDMVVWLMRAPFVIDRAASTGHPVTPQAALASFKGMSDASPSTVEVLRAVTALQQLGQEDQSAVIAAMRQAKITLNPRYGTFSPDVAGVADVNPNWLSRTAPTK